MLNHIVEDVCFCAWHQPLHIQVAFQIIPQDNVCRLAHKSLIITPIIQHADVFSIVHTTHSHLQTTPLADV